MTINSLRYEAGDKKSLDDFSLAIEALEVRARLGTNIRFLRFMDRI